MQRERNNIMGKKEVGNGEEDDDFLVCIQCMRGKAVPYSGKLLREKTLNSRISQFCGYSRKFSPRNLGAWHPWCGTSEQSAKDFSAKIVFFTNLRKFSPSKVSCCTVFVGRGGEMEWVCAAGKE